MSYITEFSGELEVSRNLSEVEIEVLRHFLREKHLNGELGVSYMSFCNWEFDEFSTDTMNMVVTIIESTKGRDEVTVLKIIINKFFIPWDIKLNGTIEAVGSEADDHWRIEVVDNVVSVHDERLIKEDKLKRLTSISEIRVLEILRYFEIYKLYRKDKHLFDNSESITVESLIDFMDSNIDKEIIEEYMKRISV